MASGSDVSTSYFEKWKNTKYTAFVTDENTCMYNNVVKMEIFSARGTHFLQTQQGQCC